MTNNVTNSDTLKKNMIKALEKNLSIVTTACKTVGISRWTHYRWMKEDEKYAEEVDDLKNVVLDFAESQLHQQMQDGSVPATIFLLKTLGKKRGYIERQEITGADGMPTNFQIEIIDKTEDTD